ncbi:MAG: HlyD family secretion protein, partial [bacterium]
MSDNEILNIEEYTDSMEIILARIPRFTKVSMYLLLLVILVAVSWAYFTKIDITAKGIGVVRPEGDVNKIQAEAGGRLVGLSVKEGDKVEKGQLLMKLEDIEVREKIQKIKVEQDRLQKDLDALSTKKTSLLAQIEIEKEKAELELKISETAVRTREDEVSSRKAEVRVALAGLKDSEQSLKSSEKLAKQNMVARVKLEEAKTVAEVARAKVEQAEARERQAKKDMQSALMSLELTKKKVSILLEESTRVLTDMENQIASRCKELESLESDLEIARHELGNREIVAPISGTVTWLGVKRERDLVEPGAMLAHISPLESLIVVEAYFPNREAGLLYKNQEVKLKYEAFPYQEYGTASGKILTISPDAEYQKDIGYVYSVTTSIDKRFLKGGGGDIGRIDLGMVAQVQAISRQQRLLSLLFQKLREKV